MINNIKITDQQKSAIISDQNHIRVIAGAGTGKTTVIAYRINYLVSDLGIDLKNILAVTFTKYAAKNLKKRLLNHNNNLNTKKLFANFNSYTYHGFCLRLISNIFKSHFKINYHINPKFEGEIKKIIKSKDFANYIDLSQLKEICSFINELKISDYSYIHEDLLKKINELTKNYYDKDKRTLSLSQLYYLVFKSYLEKQIQEKFLDFNDLLIYGLELLNDRENQKIIHTMFKHVIIDEFQDINELQYRIIKKLIGPDTSLFIVGDPDQCIYEWRGANPGIISERIKNDFPDIKTFFIDKNYRSTNNILSFSNSLIKKNYLDKNDTIPADNIFKTLHSDYEHGDKVKIIETFSENQTWDYVIENILKLKKDKSINFNNIAVLYRANYMATSLEWRLNKNKIKYKIYKGLKFLNKIVNIQIINFLLFLYSEINNNILQKIINIPPRGIGIKIIEKIQDYADKNHLSFENTFLNYYKNINVSFSSEVVDFIKKCKKYKNKAKNKKDNPANILYSFLESIHFFNYLKKRDTANNNKTNNFGNANALIQNMQTHFDNYPADNVLEFINNILIEGQDDSLENQGINLLTIHAAKGLEFEVVFLILMDYDNSFLVDYNLSEERRVYYVGTTRSQKKLFIVFNNFNNDITKDVKNICLENPAIKYINLNEPINFKKTAFDFFKQEMNADLEKNKNNLDNLLKETIIHPIFGEGYVENIIYSGNSKTAEVIFKNDNKITLNTDYILKECKIKMEQK